MGRGQVRREKAAEGLVATVAASAALDEAVGAVRTWRQCDAAMARELLLEQDNPGGVDAEATRVAGVVDHEADGRADPDWD